MAVKDNVEEMLKKYAKARNDDKWLIAAYWATYDKPLTFRGPDGELSVRLKDIQNMTTPETIRRIRQKFQSEGLYLAYEAVRDARAEKEAEMHQEMIKPVQEVLL